MFPESVSEVALLVLEARRRAREWISKHNAPLAVERRLQGAILDALVVEGPQTAAQLELIARSVVVELADQPTLREQIRRAREMRIAWRREAEGTHAGRRS